MATKARAIDWAGIEADYRAGVKTLRAIAAEHGITHAAIRKRAKRDGWVQDLSERIRAKARDKVSRAAVSKSVSTKGASDTQVVEANAQAQADVILGHRQDIGRAREIVVALFDELGAKRLTVEELALIVRKSADIKELSAEDALKLLDVLVKSVDLGSRALIVQKLAASLTALVDSERTAFNIDERTRGANEIVEGLKRLAAMPVD